MLLAYVLAFALAASGVVPIPSGLWLPSSDQFDFRIAAGFVLLVVAAIGHARWFAASRGAVNWHAGLVFGLIFLVSWLAFIDVTGDAFHQPAQASGPYTVASYHWSRTHYLTPFQAEIVTVTQWTMLIGLLGRGLTEWRARRSSG
jgi:hypothetical protein